MAPIPLQLALVTPDASETSDLLQGVHADARIFTPNQPLDDLDPAAVILVATPEPDAAVEALTSQFDRVIGIGTLPESRRLRAALAARLHVNETNIAVMCIGRAGAAAIPWWSGARVGPVPLSQFKPGGKRTLTVQERSHMLNDARTPDAETARADRLAALRTLLHAVVHDRRVILPVASRQDRIGEMSIPPTVLSLPSIVGVNGIERVVHEAPYNPAEMAGLVAATEG